MPDNRVSVVNVSDSFDKGEIALATRKAIDRVGGMSSIVHNGDLVLIKPNLVVPRTSYSGITTDLTILEEIVSEVITEKGKPIIGESSSIGYDQDLTFFILGVRRLASKIGARVVNFDKAPLTECKVPGGVIVKRVKLPQIVGEADAIINIPKMKTHELTTTTLSLKNVLGYLPRNKKQWAHIFNLNQALADLNKVIRSDLIVVDGLLSMEGNGPALGTAINTGIIIAGRNPVHVDEVACKAMGVNPNEVLHLQLAKQQLPHAGGEAEVLGNLKPRKFSLPSRSRIFRLVERIIFTMNYLLYSKLTLGGDVLPIRARLMRDVPAILGAKCTKCAECVQVCPTNGIDVKTMQIDLSKCIGCMVCAEVCRDKAIITTRMSRMKGVREFFGPRLRSPPKLIVENCVKCGECITMCPAGAISISKGTVKLDTRKCIRCVDKFCEMACRQSAIE
ncbi:MAG: DUF362 domain-containing protein [Promethearchaeati archaeon SRVP18_Atabeyarchaeia-1]